jgi:hypothetical protein
VQALGRLHAETPAPKRPRFVPQDFPPARPTESPPRKLSGFDKLIPGRRDALAREAAAEEARYRDALDDWNRDRVEFERAVAERRNLIESRIYTDVAAMTLYLEECLQDIAWPRETSVALEVNEDGTKVELDADLPEIEDMPRSTAQVPTRGLKLSVKAIPANKLRKLYADHVHSVAFRLIGETFAALPTVRSVVAAGYSQRADPATGRTRNDYLLSVAVTRQQWLAIDFAGLGSVDPVEALAQFDTKRDIAKNGALKAITPHRADA